MKKGILISALTLFILANLYVLRGGKMYVYKALCYNYVDIDDYKIFENRVVPKSPSPKPWGLSENYNKHTLSDTLRKKLETLETVAFLVIKNDSIFYEEYWDGYSSESLLGSFSVAKSIIGILVGIAIREGKIKSINDPVANYLSEFKKGKKSKIKIWHLLSMSSGLNWDEAYSSLFSMTTEAYYGNDLKNLISKLKVEHTPGVRWEYKSGDTQILGFVLEKATGMTLSEYAAQKLWQPLGAEHDALWSIDKPDGNEKAYCCFNSNARDFARIGKFMLDSGKIEGESSLTPNYYTQMISPNLLLDEGGNNIQHYGLHWWILPEYEQENIYYARGILGQYIIVIPSRKIIMVRLGHKRGNSYNQSKEEVYLMVDEVFKK